MYDLKDRRERLFGREPDIAKLIDRTRFTGLTAITGRPQMGKSWLMTELARRLSEEHEPRHLVGFARSYGESADLLRRAVVDLYQRWLANASFGEQAKQVWNQQKDKLLPGVTRAVSKIFKDLADAAKVKPVGTIVDEAITGLLKADRDLMSGGLQLPPLQYEQARDLVRVVADIGQKPIALFLDQWDESPDPALEAKTLNAFLHATGEWPRCHVFVALRPEERQWQVIEGVVKSRPGPAQVYELPAMALEDEDERHRLTAYVRKTVNAAETVGDGELLSLIDGYAGVLYRWTDDYNRAAMTTEGDLAKVAGDAQTYRFRELEALIPALEGDARRLAIRLAVLPMVASAEFWAALKPILLDGMSEGRLDELRACKLLESTDPPDFGHSKRWEVAQQRLLCGWRGTAREELVQLISVLAKPVRRVNSRTAPYALALRSLGVISRRLNVDDLSKSICWAATAIIFDSFRESNPDALLAGSRQARAEARRTGLALLAIGLFNVLNYANAIGDFGRRDVLLNELRALQTAYSDDKVVRYNLAMGLFNMLVFAKQKNDLLTRNTLLAELRSLHAAFRDDVAVREQLARVLVNALNHAEQEDDPAHRDLLLKEIRALHIAFPNDAALRQSLAIGLNNMLVYVGNEDDFPCRDALLDELRGLHQTYPDDAAVRENLALGLYNTLNAAKDENDLAHRDAVLDELRALHQAYADDGAVRERLANGLFNALNHAKEENDLAGRDARLAELRALRRSYADDAAVRAQLAKGLYNTLIHAKEEGDLSRRDELLEELRALHEACADDGAVREWLVKSLLNTLNYTKDENDLSRRDNLLDELRGLQEAYSDDAAVRDSLARGLYNTVVDAKHENDLARRDALLDELRTLKEAYPDDGAVREQLAKGLLTAR